MVDCLLAFFLSGLARPVWTTGLLGTLNTEETSRETTDFHLQKLASLALDGTSSFCCAAMLHLRETWAFQSFLWTGGARSIIHSMPGKFLPQETNDERLTMSYEWQRAKDK